MMNVLLPVDLSSYGIDEEFLEQICYYVLGGSIEIVAGYIEDCASIKYPTGKDDTMFRDEMGKMWGEFNRIVPTLNRAFVSGRTDTLANSCTLYKSRINVGYINLEVNRW